MALTTDNIKYAASASITCTLASLTSSTTVGRGSAVIDNTSNLYADVMVTLGIMTSAGTQAAVDKACYIYLYGSEDGVVYNGSSAEAEGSDASLTFDSPTNLRGPYVLSCPSSSTTYRLVIGSVASSFGGVMPRKWGVVVQNYSGLLLNATESNHQKTYTGITYTNQ